MTTDQVAGAMLKRSLFRDPTVTNPKRAAVSAFRELAGLPR
jgi:hypothetical protein